MSRVPIRLSNQRKYRNQPQVVDGLRFDSKKEAKRYQELKMLQSDGVISGLKADKKELRWPLEVEGELICTYEADFDYMEKFGNFAWSRVIEDVKGVRTPEYKIKRKLMKAIYGITVREI